jgi:hypothetical protein
VTAALPVVGFPLMLLAAITTSFTAAELLVLSTDNRNQVKVCNSYRISTYLNLQQPLIIIIIIIINYIIETTLPLETAATEFEHT